MKMDDATVEVDSIFLHQDIITEILLRLPAKSLLRFKTVCKSWRALMKTHHFDSLRRKLQLLIGDTTGMMLVYNLKNDSYSGSVVVRNIYAKAGGHELPSDVKNIFKFSMRCRAPIFDQPTIIGPCNGVYLITDRWRNTVLWNHATRDYKVLSPMQRSPMDSHAACGFGSDELLGGGLDFLIVIVHRKRLYILFDDAVKMPELYKSSSGVWKELRMPFPKECWTCYSTEYINKVFYWLGRDWKTDRYFLVSFDTRIEVFDELDLPVSVGARDILSSFVSDGNQFLSLLVFNGDLDVWVLKELGGAGIGKSWFRAETLSSKGRSKGGEGIDLMPYMPSANVQYEESLVSLRDLK